MNLQCTRFTWWSYKSTSFYSYILLLTSKLCLVWSISSVIGAEFCFKELLRLWRQWMFLPMISEYRREWKLLLSRFFPYSAYTLLLFIAHVRAYAKHLISCSELLLSNYNFNFWSHLYQYVLEAHQFCTIYLSFD